MLREHVYEDVGQIPLRGLPVLRVFGFDHEIAAAPFW